MDLSTYTIESRIEKNHWWFRGRRYLFKTILNNLNIPQKAKILDVGSSSGTNLRMLKEMGFSNYQGLDISLEAQTFCKNKGLGKVIIDDIQSPKKLEPNSYDCVLITDVVEHLTDDEEAIKNVFFLLKEGGYMLLTVPAFKMLWGPQDILSHHLRRYCKKEIKDLAEKHHFTLLRMFYFNFILFFPILFVRKLLMRFCEIKNENNINNRWINRILLAIFHFDCWLALLIPFPFGVSLCLIAQKPIDKKS